MAEVRIAGLSKRYGKKIVHAGLNLDIADGECFTLLGPSGCGKTVLMRLIAGFEAPDAGSITIGDARVADAATGTLVAPNHRGIGVVFQDYAVWPHMSVADNVAYPLKLAGISKAEMEARTARAIELVGLTGLAERLPSQLSGGQQQRVALARALISEPRLLLLDEPLNNLDANLREEMRFEIKALQQTLGITVVYVTHDQEIALGIADRLAVMDGTGHVRQIGTPETIYEQPVDDFVFRFMGVANFLPVVRDAEGWRAGAAGASWPGELPKSEAPIWTAGFRPGDVMLSRDGAGLPGIVRRASFLGSTFDYLIELAGTPVRAALSSHEALAGGLVFREGESCRATLAALHWFEGDLAAGEAR